MARNDGYQMIHRAAIILFAATACALAQGSTPLELPAPPVPPEPGPLGLMLLSVLLSFVCLPLGLLAFVVLLLAGIKLLALFKITPARILAGLVAGGGVGAIRMMLWPVALLVTVPPALLATGWAARLLDRRLDIADRLLFGCAAGVLVAVVLVAVVKKIAGVVRKRMLSGMMPGMPGGPRGIKQAKPAGRGRRK